MADVIIHRCTLRVVRRRGWSWGPGPERLLRAAVAALPMLLARKLGDLFEDDADVEISGKVNLTIPVRLSELLELGTRSTDATSEISQQPSDGALEERLAAAVKLTFAGEPLAHEVLAQDTNIATPTVDFETHPLEDEKLPCDHALRFLLEWKVSGELEIHLASFSEQELGAWLAALGATLGKLAALSEGDWPEKLSRLVEELTKGTQGTSDRASALRQRLRALLEIGERLRVTAIDESSLQETFNQVTAQFGLTDHQLASGFAVQSESELRAESPEPFLCPWQPGPPVIEPASQITVSGVTHTEFNVRSVLPFLLLGPLSKIGYFDALAATLETIGLSSQSSLFATALAYKVLKPPARGWRRDGEDLFVAAAFCGVETPPPGEALAELARKMSGHLTALDSLLSYTLVKGHDPDSAMLLHRTREEAGPDGFLLVEMDGLFPVAWANDLRALMPALRYFSATHLLIEQASADVDTLLALDASGFRFITDAPPTRGETWREIRRSSRDRWYTNDIDAKQAALARTAADLTRSAEETELLWRALKVDRPAIPTARNSELERIVTMAAALALGSISWALWRERETVTPLLALERFGSLAGKVRFTSTAVELHLPLGLRRRDLQEHGLLADVQNVPWLAGRKVEFLGG